MPDVTKTRGPKPGPHPLMKWACMVRVDHWEWLHEERDRTGESLSRIVGRGIEAIRRERDNAE